MGNVSSSFFIYNEVAESSDQYQATPRPLQRKVREKMCTSRTSRNNTSTGQQNSNGEEFQWQGGLYPDLSGLFGAERGERSSGEEREERQPAMMILLRLLGLSQDQLQPAPSAPS